jgi:hypothetical protein
MRKWMQGALLYDFHHDFDHDLHGFDNGTASTRGVVVPYVMFVDT